MTGLPPARYDINQPDYDHNIGMRIRIFFNGEEQSDCLSYDCEAGNITRYKRDKDGNPIIEGDEFQTETLTGLVTVKWLDHQDFTPAD